MLPVLGPGAVSNKGAPVAVSNSGCLCRSVAMCPGGGVSRGWLGAGNSAVNRVFWALLVNQVLFAGGRGFRPVPFLFELRRCSLGVSRSGSHLWVEVVAKVRPSRLRHSAGTVPLRKLSLRAARTTRRLWRAAIRASLSISCLGARILASGRVF